MDNTLEQMTVWSLVSDASLLVQAVMLSLLLASLLSWYLIIQRGSVLRRLERQLNGFVQRFRAAPDLQALSREIQQAGEGGIAPIFIAGVQEYQHLHGHDPAVLEGVERALQVAITEQEIELEKGLQFLATVGSVSPYIGLFGTVWGIMNSFIGIAHSNTTNLAVVAPGIAEALLATALGLVAAIPAVLVYNHFSRVLAGLRGLLGDLSAAVQQLVSRDLDRAAPRAAAAPLRAVH